MKKIVVVCAGFALALGASMAHATKPGNNGGGNGGCGVGQATNGCGGSNTANGGSGTGVGIGVGVGIGQGGAGGAGGQGGRGGEGGSVWGSGNSSNHNTNAQGQIQGQQQGQAQSSRNTNKNANSNRNDNRSQATGGNSNATGGNGYANNENHGNNSNQSVTVQGDSYDSPRIPVATAYAPNIAPTAVCMGSTSAGGQGMTFGISFGTSWTDDNCMLLEQVRTVAAVIGDREIAAEMMCDVAAYAAARERAGKPCGKTQAVAQAAPTTATAATTSTAPRSSRYDGNDPIVRQRLGLPPLKQ